MPGATAQASASNMAAIATAAPNQVVRILPVFTSGGRLQPIRGQISRSRDNLILIENILCEKNQKKFKRVLKKIVITSL